MRILLAAAAIAAATAVAAPATAAVTITVSARSNSSSGGTPLSTGLTFAAGKQFRISSSVNDLWSAGALPRFSDGSGLVGDRFKTAADDAAPNGGGSYAIGTLIGTNFNTHTQGNLTAPFGSLVASLGGNNWQLLGANGVFTSAGGPLNLAYFDSNADDNFGEITFTISAVPEAATWAMMIVGLGIVGGSLRTRRRSAVALNV